MARHKERIKIELPKGYKAITGMGGEPVNWKKGVVIEGIVTETKTLKRKNPKKGESLTMRLMNVKTKDGDKTVWEKAALTALFDMVKKGNTVYIQHIGMGIAKKGQSAPHLFVAGLK